MALERARARRSPLPSELLSITDRAKHLGALRLGLGAVAIAGALIWPAMAVVPVFWLVVATTAYLCVSGALLAIAGRTRRIALPALRGGLLLDGIYLATVIALTGGASSPLRFLLYAHVVGVTLLCSYRTGLKLTLWDTMLFLLVVEAIEADLLPGPATTDIGVTALTVVAMWILALGTAAFSAASERELRSQKVDLADLSGMIARIDGLETSRGVEEHPGDPARCSLLDLRVRPRGRAGLPGGRARGARLDRARAAQADPFSVDPVVRRAWDRADTAARSRDRTDDRTPPSRACSHWLET